MIFFPDNNIFSYKLLLCVIITVPVLGYEVGVWTLMAVLTFPISFLKQCVSVVQLVVACQNIAVLDSSIRARRATDTH